MLQEALSADEQENIVVSRNTTEALDARYAQFFLVTASLHISVQIVCKRDEQHLILLGVISYNLLDSRYILDFQSIAREPNLSQ